MLPTHTCTQMWHKKRKWWFPSTQKPLLSTNFDDMFEIDCRMCTELKYICLQYYSFSIVLLIHRTEKEWEDIYNWQRFYDTFSRCCWFYRFYIIGMVLVKILNTTMSKFFNKISLLRYKIHLVTGETTREH